MASFVVETYVPQGNQERFAADVDGIRAAAEVIVVVAGQVHHVRSYLVPGDEMGFHVVEADTAEDVVRVAELAGIEVERIVEAIGVGPGRGVEDGTEEVWWRKGESNRPSSAATDVPDDESGPPSAPPGIAYSDGRTP